MKKSFFGFTIGLFMLASCTRETSERQNADTVKVASPSIASLKENTGYFPELDTYLQMVVANFKSIPDDRKQKLEKLAIYIRTKVQSKEEAQLIFICTHNSRRSHISQLWATVAADYYGIQPVKAFSGGTEATAFNPRAVSAMERAGFKFKKTNEDKNPVYEVSFGTNKPKQTAFSKKYDAASNPKDNFAAVMTCSNADKNCPNVAGASLRVAIPYEDPKVADDTDKEVATYDERAFQIATEEFYLFSLVK